MQTILSQQQTSYYTRFSWIADMWLLFCRLKMEDMRMRVSISTWSWTFWRSPTYTWWENPWGNSGRWCILPSTNSTGSHLWTLHTGWSTSGWEHVTISQHCTMIRWSWYPDIHTREVSSMFLFCLLCFKIFILIYKKKKNFPVAQKVEHGASTAKIMGKINVNKCSLITNPHVLPNQ